MGYKKNKWLKGDTISSDKLNVMEQGIADANAPETWGNIKNKPSKFNPSEHEHKIEDIEGLAEVIKDLKDQIKELQ